MVTMNPRLADIQKKMLDAPDHYRDISGAFHIRFANVQQDDQVDFEASPVDHSSRVTTMNALGQSRTDVATTAKQMSLWPQERTYQMQSVAPAEASAPAGPRHYHNAQCQPVFTHREDPAHAFAASDVSSPENYAFWLSTSASSITGHTQLLGRNVTVIQGQQDAYLAEKLGAATFTMWVDDATGILLKLRGNNSQGRTVYSIDVSRLSINRGLKHDIASVLTPPAGWNELASPQRVGLQMQ